jgi:hypothetical protein
MQNIVHEIKTNGGQKIAGIITDGVLRIIKTSKSHFVKKYSGYGIALDTLEDAKARGVQYIELTGYDGEYFRVPLDAFMRAGIRANLGHGMQAFLSVKNLRYYSRIEELKNAVDPIAQRRERQMSLFGGEGRK